MLSVTGQDTCLLDGDKSKVFSSNQFVDLSDYIATREVLMGCH